MQASLNTVATFAAALTPTTSTLTLENGLISGGILLVFLLTYRLMSTLLFKVFRLIAKKLQREVYTSIVHAFEKPVRYLILVIGLYIAYKYLTVRYLPFAAVSSFVDKLMRISVILSMATGFYNLEAVYTRLFFKLDDHLNIGSTSLVKLLLVKTIRVVIMMMAIGMAASEFFDVNGFIAGLGIAGLAVAMAAKDTLGNLISGVTLIMDRPYDIGEWISCSGVEGEVEELSFRSTRIRTATKEIVVVPNSILAANPISNYSRRGLRRLRFILGITYDATPDQLKTLRDRILVYFETEPMVLPDGRFVRFDEFAQSSLDLIVNCFVDTNDLGLFLELKEKVQLNVMDIMREVGTSPAFPSVSVYMEKTK